MADPIPDWVEGTPVEPSYSLAMFDNEGNTPQEIDVTRAEYVALKRHLAAIRGYRCPDPADVHGMETILKDLATEFTYSDGSGIDKDISQIARHVMVARDIFRRTPDLITYREPGLDQLLLRMSEEDYDQEQPVDFLAAADSAHDDKVMA
jgi:hypothetical protein